MRGKALTALLVVLSLPCACLSAGERRAGDIYIDDAWIGDGTNRCLRAVDLTSRSQFDVETVSDLVLGDWQPMYQYRYYDLGHGYGYGAGVGCGPGTQCTFTVSFHYGYGYGAGGTFYRPLVDWTAGYTTQSDRVFYRLSFPK